MSGQSNEFRALCALFNKDYTPNDAPKIPLDDALLVALKLAHGEAGRPDSFSNSAHHIDVAQVSGMARLIPGGATGQPGLKLPSEYDVVPVPVRHHRGHRPVEHLVSLGRADGARRYDRCRTGLDRYRDR